MSQCPFVKNGYAVDPNDFAIYNKYNCIKPQGHSGKHAFHTNPKFFKNFSSAELERKKILQRLVGIGNENKANPK